MAWVMPTDESIWMRENDPIILLHVLKRCQPATSTRKLRLFACACVRRVWHLLEHEASRQAVEYVEQVIDTPDWESTGSLERRRALAQAAGQVKFDPTDQPASGQKLTVACAAVHACEERENEFAAAGAVSQCVHTAMVYAGSSHQEEDLPQAALLREIVGNPFRPVAISPHWLTTNDGLVASLARTIYDERAFDRMPILGDALEDAGCSAGTLLDHCRSTSPHVRGCWLLDLILGLQ
jgi:hypothetical protein